MNWSALLSSIALLSLSPIATSAATIAGDTFDLNVSLDQEVVSFVGLSSSAVASGTVSTVDNFEVSWFDNDTFIVRAGSGFTIAGISFELIGLDFLEGLLPASIVGVTYDPIASNLYGYVGYSSIQPPVASFTANSILVTLGLIPSQAFPEPEFIDEFGPSPVNVAADFVPFYFNVSTRTATGPATVPLPAGGALLLASLGLLATSPRRRHR